MNTVIAAYNIEERIPQTSNVLRSMLHLAGVWPASKARTDREMSDFCNSKHASATAVIGNA